MTGTSKARPDAREPSAAPSGATPRSKRGFWEGFRGPPPEIRWRVACHPCRIRLKRALRFDGKFLLDNRPGPCYDRQRGLDIPDVSPEGNPLPRRPEFEPSAGRPSLFPIEGGHILCGRGGMADAPDLGSGAPVAYGFKSLRPHHFIRSGTCGSSSVVECHLAKVDVASSNLVYRSTFSEGSNAQAIFGRV